MQFRFIFWYLAIVIGCYRRYFGTYWDCNHGQNLPINDCDCNLKWGTPWWNEIYCISLAQLRTVALVCMPRGCIICIYIYYTYYILDIIRLYNCIFTYIKQTHIYIYIYVYIHIYIYIIYICEMDLAIWRASTTSPGRSCLPGARGAGAQNRWGVRKMSTAVPNGHEGSPIAGWFIIEHPSINGFYVANIWLIYG